MAPCSLNGGVGGQSRRPCQMLAGSKAPIGSAREEPGSLRRPFSGSHLEGLIQIRIPIHIPGLWNCLKCCGRFVEHTRDCSGSSIPPPPGQRLQGQGIASSNTGAFWNLGILGMEYSVLCRCAPCNRSCLCTRVEVAQISHTDGLLHRSSPLTQRLFETCLPCETTSDRSSRDQTFRGCRGVRRY